MQAGLVNPALDVASELVYFPQPLAFRIRKAASGTRSICMHKRALFLLVFAVGTLGCRTMSRTQEGALVGGTAGATIGAMAGAQNGRPGTGAAVGGLIGTTIGALAGDAADRDEARIRQAQLEASQPVVGPLSLEEIVRLTERGVEDQIIINQIRTSGTRYNLNPDTILWLQDHRVAPAVVREMQATARREPRSVYVERDVYGPPPVVYERVPVVVPVGPRHYHPRPGFSVGASWGFR